VNSGKTAYSIEMPFEWSIRWAMYQIRIEIPHGKDNSWEKIAKRKCNVYGGRGIGRAKTAEPIKLQFATLSGVGAKNYSVPEMTVGRAHCYHLANTVERLCAAFISCSPLGVATRPVPKLLWSILLL